MSLGMLTYFRKKFDNPHITWVIADRLKQFVPFYQYHPEIDMIYTCKGAHDGIDDNDRAALGDNDIWIDVTPQHPNGASWYSKFTCVEETVRMSYGSWAKDHLGLNSPDQLLADFKKVLTEQEQKPRLYKWWKEKKYFENKTIGIFPVAGYNDAGLARNPSQQFYEELIFDLQKEGYKVAIFGYHKDFKLGGDYNFVEKSLFDQVKVALTTDLVIGTDSGSAWLAGAYGIPQVNIIQNFYPNGREDFWPLTPENCEGNAETITCWNGWGDLTTEKVIKEVEKQLDISYNRKDELQKTF